METIAIICLTLLLGAREYFHFVERKDMADRLMSRNFEDYKRQVEPQEDNEWSEEEREAISILEAKEDLMENG